MTGQWTPEEAAEALRAGYLSPSPTPVTGTPMYVSWLRDALDAISRYTNETQRLGMHDLSLLDTLRDREAKGTLNCTAFEAMVRLIDAGETIYIGGPRGADLWTFFDEDVDETLKRVGLSKPGPDDEAE